MSLSVFGITTDLEVTVGSTQATINCTTAGPGSYIYGRYTVGNPTTGYARIAARVSTATTTEYYSPVTGPVTLTYTGPSHTGVPTWPGNITITGLATNQTFQYIIEGSTGTATTTATGWYNEPTQPGNSWSRYGTGYFTTLTTDAAVPNVNITAADLSGSAPFVAQITYLTSSGTTTYPSINNITWNYGDGVIETFYSTNRPGVSYDWYHPIHTYNVSSTYTVVATGANASGTDTGSLSLTVSPPAVTATFTYATATVTDREVSVTVTDSSTTNDNDDNPIAARLWAITGPNTSTASITSNVASWNAVIGTNVTSVGSYSITLTVTGALAVTSSTTLTQAFWVNYLPASATFTAAPLVAQVSDTVTFYNNSAGDITTAVWSFGDTSTASTTALTTTHSYTTGGVFNVNLVVTASSTATATNSSSATRTGYISVIPANYYTLLGGMLEEIQWHLMGDPNQLPCDALDLFGGSDNVLSVYYRRLHDFLDETQVTRTEATLAADTAGIYPLPADLIELCRVEVGGVAVQAMDPKQADLYEQAWESDTQTAYGYCIEPQDSLTLRLVPKLTGQTIKVVYVQAPNTASEPNDCLTWDPLPLPYTFSWIVKWGVLADLLGAEGEMNDPVRAKFAEDMYRMGVELAKQMFRPIAGA